MCPASSPTPSETRSRPSPITPTPIRVRGDEPMQNLTPTQEPTPNHPRENDDAFQEYVAPLKDANSLVSFRWDAENSVGTLVSIPYPLDSQGRPVEPLDLLRLPDAHHWSRPSCFCAKRGSPRVAQLIISSEESQEGDAVCLICPALECPYFVNVNDLIKDHRAGVLAVRDSEIDVEGTFDASDNGTGVATAEVPRKRKRNLRGVRSNGNGVLPRHAPPNLAPNDQPSVGLALTVSNLLSRHGAIQEQFFDQFSLCSTCNRIVCIELSRLGRHTCVIEVED